MGKRAAKLIATDGVRWAFMKVFEIPDLDDPTQTYLKRWRVIQTPYFAIYLHKIMLPDGDRSPHNHPWDFRSFVLKGQYTEEFRLSWATKDKPQTWKRWSSHKMFIHNFHRITLLEVPTWTLVFCGKRRQDWGFYDADEGYVPHAEYIESHYGE